MNRIININVALMLLLGFIFNYLTVGLITTGLESGEYIFGFALGRAISSILMALFLVWVFRKVTRKKPTFTKGSIIASWVLFILLSFMALIGNMLPA